MKSDIIDVNCFRHHATDNAILVSDDGERDSAIWLPKSQVEIEETDTPNIVVIALPEWLAQDKGLI